MLSCLTVFSLTGCGTPTIIKEPVEVPVVEYRTVKLDPALLVRQPCPKLKDLKGKPYGDAIEALEACNNANDKLNGQLDGIEKTQD